MNPLNARRVRTLFIFLTGIAGFALLLPVLSFAQEQPFKIRPAAGTLKTDASEMAEIGELITFPENGDKGTKINAVVKRFFAGAAAGDNFGYSVASAGDVNGDGFSDVIIGAYLNDAGGSAAGRAYIYYGGKALDAGADVFLTGEASGDYFGYSVASAGDVNGDGLSDVIVGAYGNDASGNNTGRAYIYYGDKVMDAGADIILTGKAAGDWFGFSAASAGDVNGDSFNDVIIGAYLNDDGGSNAGRAMDAVADVIATGEAANDYFGVSVASAGDVNGDGFSDVIVGARYNDAGGGDAGRAYVYYGGRAMDAVADVIATGEAAGDYFGRSVASAGDVNSDGLSDVIMGAPGNDTGGSDAGLAYFYMNALTGADIPDWTITGESAGDLFGYSVASAGDVNGDGFSDVIIGANCNNANGENAGRAYIYYGGKDMDAGADVILTGEAAFDYFGNSVASAGDVNGDGFSDVVVSAYRNDAGGSDAGRAYVYYGGKAMDASADVTLTGEAVGDLFGYSVASAGDVNGDGFSDMIIGAYTNDAGGSDAGRAYVYCGGRDMDARADIILTGEAAFDYFGNSVASAGDVNGDGFSDVIVGASGNDAGGTSAGRAYIYYGGTAMDASADVTLTGEAVGDLFGYSVASAGDVNGDGFSEVVVGVYQIVASGTNTGRAYIYYGGNVLDATADVILTGEAAFDYFGNSVASAGDVNGDGFSDVVVGALQNDAGGIAAGRAYVYYGGRVMDIGADIILTGEAVVDWFGESVASTGDINGDGLSDVILGAPGNDAGGDDAGRAYVYISSSPPIVPGITRVSDVPFDQGGKVTVFFARSGYDAIGITKITDYLIQRSLPPGVAGFAWEHIATLAATQDPVYSYTATTPYDSSAKTSGQIFYRVVARTANPLESWKSRPVAGYSVDNLAPAALQFLAAELVNGTEVRLTWNTNRTDTDVKHYKIFRASKDGFAPHPDFEIAATADTIFVDRSPVAGKNNYYRVVTVDSHGNPSLPSPQASVVITAVTEESSELPTEFALDQNYPNPFNPTTTIQFAVPKQTSVTIKIYDLLGRQVTTLVEDEFDPGVYKVTFQAEGLPSGIYFYRLQANEFVHTRKLTLLR